jgi:hypothetical protein
VTRLKLAGIFLACAAPFALAWMAYVFGWASGTTANYGELIAPRPLAGAPFEALRGKWVLVTADAAACGAGCENNLYLMRQVRRAQGKDMGRIERLWLLADAATPRPELLAAIDGTRVAAYRDAAIPSGSIYLIDPLGNLMMRFPRDADGSRMIRDLQRLLKASSVG